MDESASSPRHKHPLDHPSSHSAGHPCPLTSIPVFRLSCRAVSDGARVLAIACLLGLYLTPASAVIDGAVTDGVWKVKYGVTAAQWSDANWLLADSDGDGMPNGSELGFGTNPFVAGSIVQITAITVDSNNASLTFPTLSGKKYVLQGSASLSGFADLSPAIATTGDGSQQTLIGPQGGYKFFRVVVQDIDTDGDGVSDWAEIETGLNPNSATSSPGVNDHDVIAPQFATPYVINISAATPFASEDGPTAGSFVVTRTNKIFPITLTLSTDGTALGGIDYSTLPGSVTFPAGVDTVTLPVVPIQDSPTNVVEGSKSVTSSLVAPAPSASFPAVLGSNPSATVIINDSSVAAGTGLQARYYDTASSTYVDAANFGQVGFYNFTRNASPTTTGLIVVPYAGAMSVGNVVKLTFTTGNLNNVLYNSLNYTVTAVSAGVNFTVGISAAAALPVSGTGMCSFSIQSSPHPASITRVDSTVNFDWQHGTPNGVAISPNNSPDHYSATWEAYLQPTTAGAYTFQLDADDKARVLLDTGSGLTQIVEHNWTTPGSDSVGTFKQSAPITLAVPATPAQRYKIRVEHVETTGDARCRLQWKLGSGSFANIPQANQYTHTQPLSYSYTNGNAVITPTGGHAFNVNDTVTLAFSSGVLFTPDASSTHNKNYSITAVNGTTTYTVAITGFSVPINGATTTAGSNVISVPSTAGLAVGMTVSGTGLPAGEFITAIVPSAAGSGIISATTGVGVTAQASTNLTAVLPATGTLTGNGFVLNNTGSSTTGLYNLCYANTTFANSPGRVGVDAAVTTGNNGLWGAGTPDVNLIQPDTFSVRWTGQVQPQFSEDYTFVVQADDGCSLWINGQLQTLKMSPSALTGGSTYTYDSTSGEVAVTYSGLAASANSFLTGETVRLDPSNLNLVHAPTNSPSYTYNAATGLAVVDYTNLVIGQPGGTRTAGSYTVGETVEVDPISGSASALSNSPFVITAIDAANNKFTINLGAGAYVTGSGNITLTDNRNAIVAAVYASGSTYSYDGTTGNAVITYSNLTSVTPGAFVNGASVDLVPTSGNLSPRASATYVITAATSTTFTVNFGAGGTTGTGSMIIRSTPGGVIPASITNAFTVNIGAGKYAATNATTSSNSINVDIVSKSLKEWSSNGNERFVRIPMIGGVRYDIQLDYYENSGYSRCGLSWYSASQTKQIIPQERLYPSSGVIQQPPAHITATDATALAGGLFSLPVVGSNGGSVSVSGNPAWLTYSGGVLSGTPPSGAAGNYQVLITITNAAGTSTSVVNLRVDENAGTIPREIWSGVAGTTVASIPTGTNPTSTTNLTSLAAPTGVGPNYGARIRGYITAPTTGNYYFWIAANNSAELWISNDDEPVNAFKRAWVTTGNATPQTWSGESNQKSPWMALEQGRKYYIEILHKAGAGTGDNLAVGWAKPGEAATAPSQVVPGFVLSPYVAPNAGSTPGTLYVATMLAQNGAVTHGVGSSTLRLSEDENTAIMTYSYAGLTGPITSQHIHTDPYLNKASTIVYDIDTPATSGDGLQSNGSYKWTINPVGTLTKADIVEIIKQGKAYINLHTAAYPAGEIRGNYTLANGTRTFSPPPAPPSWTDDSNTDAGAVRFLTQATFGANIADIAALKALAPSGATNSRYETWINNQFGISATQHLPEVLAREIGDVFGSFDIKVSVNTWWKTSMTAPDQLRQRVAFALSEIHVVSGQGPLEDNSLAISHFYDTLLSNAFGNFGDILTATTLTPGMGRYLDMLRNDKPDLTVGRIPNENYAREIQQLFSIGLYRMWPDGSLVLTSKDAPIDTYSQREIVGFSHIFTGWDYGYNGPLRTSLAAPADWTRPMREVPARHFTGSKRVLNNEVLPGLATAGGQPLDPYATHNATHFADAAYQALPVQENIAAHNQLFNHPNVGPFICRQLIQRMVTSSPSRDYLYRVVQKFNDNGSGVRGDMQAVIKAILLDYEARSSSEASKPAFGKQREPIMRVANAARAFRPANIGGTYAQTGSNVILITTSSPHLLTAGNSVFLEFVDTTPGQPAPTSGTYTVLTTTSNPPAPAAPTGTSYYIAAPGWMTSSANNYTQTAGASTITVTMPGHWLPAGGQAYFKFIGATGTTPADGVYNVVSSTAVDFPSGTGNNPGTTFTITAPDTTARSGRLLISRFPGSYSCTGRAGVITIDTAYSGVGTYGTMADHGLSVGDTVFLNFTNSRDTTSFNETSTENDLVYTVVSVPDPNTFTVAARDAANAAMNSDNQVVIFPLKAQPLARNGTINTRPSTFTMDNTDTDLQQTPLNSTTVFNFFLPDFKFAGTLASQGISTPEFQLTSETTAIRQANYLYAGVYGSTTGTTGTSSFKTGTNALVMDFSPWLSNANDLGLGAGPQTGQAWTSNANIGTLIDRLNTLLMAGQLPAGAKTNILNFIGRQITSITAGTPCTINMGSAHGWVVGDSVTITGVSGSTFNGASTTGNGTFTVVSVPTPAL